MYHSAKMHWIIQQPYEHGSKRAAEYQTANRLRALGTHRASNGAPMGIRTDMGYMQRLTEEGKERVFPMVCVDRDTVSMILVDSSAGISLTIGFYTKSVGQSADEEVVYETWDAPAGLSSRTVSIPVYLMGPSRPFVRVSGDAEVTIYARHETSSQYPPGGQRPVTFFNSRYQFFVVSPIDTPERKAGVAASFENPRCTVEPECTWAHDNICYGFQRLAVDAPQGTLLSNNWRVASPANPGYRASKFDPFAEDRSSSYLRLSRAADYTDGLILKLSRPMVCTLVMLSSTRCDVMDAWLAPAGLSFYTGSIPSMCLPYTEFQLVFYPVVADPPADSEVPEPDTWFCNGVCNRPANWPSDDDSRNAPMIMTSRVLGGKAPARIRTISVHTESHLTDCSEVKVWLIGHLVTNAERSVSAVSTECFTNQTGDLFVTDGGEARYVTDWVRTHATVSRSSYREQITQLVKEQQRQEQLARLRGRMTIPAFLWSFIRPPAVPDMF